jgi:hypothetical protein
MGAYDIPKTVFVLGAGASHGLGFPLGHDLKSELLVHLKPNNALFQALAQTGFSQAQLSKFARTLERAEFDTIDDHLRAINDSESREIGHRAVAFLIRMKENDPALFHTDGNPKHWYKALANHLRQHRDHASPNHFSFITYNYDRSFPHYLFETLLARNVPEENLRSFLGDANLHHMHGHVGELPWQFKPGASPLAYHQYGAQLSISDLAAHTPKILHPDDEGQHGLLLTRMVGNARAVVFVGFGFHASNLRRLPFGSDRASGSQERKYFSINPDPPPAEVGFEGQSIVHMKGPAEQVMGQFFADLASGKLLKPDESVQNAVPGHIQRKVIKVIR